MGENVQILGLTARNCNQQTTWSAVHSPVFGRPSMLLMSKAIHIGLHNQGSVLVAVLTALLVVGQLVSSRMTLTWIWLSRLGTPAL